MIPYAPKVLTAGFPGLPSDWSSEPLKVQSADGKVSLFSVCHRQTSAPVKRLLFALHGHGEHCGRYFHFPHYLKNTVDAVVCIDHRGHGLSEGGRGHTPGFSAYVDDAVKVMNAHLAKYTEGGVVPTTHLFAHSMGGLVGLLLLTSKKGPAFKSATISAPLLGVKVKVPIWKKAPAYALAAMAPNFTLPSDLNPADISHDTNVVEAYKKDPLCHDKCTAGWYVDLQGKIKSMNSTISGIDTPIQFCIPLADAICDADATLAFAGKLNSRDKRICAYNDFFHESFNEKNKDRAFADLNEWLKKHS